MKNRIHIILFILLIIGTSIFSADKKAESASEKDITRIMKMVFFYHYNKKELTNDLMKKTMHNFLAKEIDYQRLYFLKEDYEKWMNNANLIGKAYGAPIGTGEEWRFIFDIQKEFEKRYRTQVEIAHKSLEEVGSVDQTLTFQEDPETRGFPSTVEESSQWLNFYMHYNLGYMMQKKKYTFLESKNKLKEERKRSEEKRLKKTDLDTVKLFINAFNEAVDPHTNYYSPLDYQDFNDDMKLSFEGIGARLLRDEVSGVTMLVEIMPDGPAFKGGLLKKFDEVLGVKEEKDSEFKNVVGLEINEVVRLIKGPGNTTVVLKVRRTEDNQIAMLEIPVVRGKVNSKDEEATITYERVTDGNSKNTFLIGVLHLPSFYRDFDGASKGDKNARSSANDVEALLLEAQKNKVDGIILNLLGNSGGSLTDAIKIVGLFINNGPVVITKNNKGEEIVRKDVDEGVVYEGPLLIAINKRSASASEIVAGALKDYNRGLIVGEERTFGKGTVQEIYPLGKTQTRGDIGAIKITINQFFTAGGDSTQWNGVSSDIRFPSYYDGSDVGEKEYPEALKFEKVKNYTDMEKAGSKWFVLNNDIKQQLKDNSALRINANADFLKIRKEVEKINSKKEELKILKTANFFKPEKEEDEPVKLPDFDKKLFDQFTRVDQNEIIKHLNAMKLFPKKNFGIDESAAQYIADCLNQLLGNEKLNELIPRDIKHGANLKSRSLVLEIENLQRKDSKTPEDLLNLVILRKKLLIEYYPDLKGPYQNSLFIKESLNIMSDLIKVSKSKETTDAKLAPL